MHAVSSAESLIGKNNFPPFAVKYDWLVLKAQRTPVIYSELQLFYRKGILAIQAWANDGLRFKSQISSRLSR